MKKYISSSLTLIYLWPTIASAEDLVYTLGAPVPGGKATANNFTEYISFLFPFMLSVAAISALVMFILGGIEYMLGGASPERMKSGKERISNAIWGLMLAVFSVLILQTINPNLVTLSLKLGDVGKVTPSSPPPAYIPGTIPNNAPCTSSSECASGLCAQDPNNAGKLICLRTGIPLGSECTITDQCSKTSASPLTCKSGFCVDH